MSRVSRLTAPAFCLRAAMSCVVLLAATVFSLPAAAAYPERPIRIIVPFPPGGASDVIARLFADKFAQTWGVTAVVDNRTGASGIIGTDLVAKSAPDGYTLGMVALSFAINPAIHKLPYDSDRDFTFVTIAASNPLVLVAAGLLARNAERKGLKPRPWVKTSLSPGSAAPRPAPSASGTVFRAAARAAPFPTQHLPTSALRNSRPPAPAAPPGPPALPPRPPARSSRA